MRQVWRRVADIGENPVEEANNDCVFFTTREGSMKQVKMLSAAVLLGLAGAANAGVSSTITATNDYDFRGFSQSATDPAIQASLDYSHDSGFYVGAWASNVDFGPAADVSFELDLYVGFTGKINDDFSWDAGLIYYTYPDESDFNFPEIYGGFTWKWLKAKLSYSNDFGGSDEDAYYLDGTATIPLPGNFSLLAHVGYSDGDGVDAVVGDSYMDYSFGVGYSFSNFNFALKYVGSDAPENTADVFNNEDRVIFTVATTLPWK
jgi:uncharacterized protein (TIGR02001 family)